MDLFDNASFRLSGKKIDLIPLNTSAADNELLAAQIDPGPQEIRVVSGWIVVSGAGTLVFKEDDDELYRVTFPAAGSYPLPRNGDGWIRAGEGKALNMDNDDTITVTGHLTYVLIGGRR